PWTLLLPGLVRWLLRRPGEPEARRRPAALGVFLLAAIWGLLFYSLSGCKRAVYVVPVLPPLALALGCYLHHLLWTAGPKPHKPEAPAKGGVPSLALQACVPEGTLQAIRERW